MLAKTYQSLRETAADLAWKQWQSVGSMASSRGRAKAIVDPEALVLLSLALRDSERRLWDMLVWWAFHGARLLSVQRVKNLLRRYPDSVQERLGEFAYVAYHEGGDYRWKALAGAGPGPKARPEKVREQELELIEPPTLMLRLRLGLGVGTKADLLSFLIGTSGNWASVKVIATATDYSSRAIRRAADEMTAARLVHATSNSPTEYFVDPEPWRRVLEMPKPLPKWRHWEPVFAFVCHLLDLAERNGPQGATPYVMSSRLRELVETHSQAFEWNRISLPDPKRYRGVKYLDAFKGIEKDLVHWMERNV